MGHFNKNAVWHDKIYQLERTDPVVGGEGGISNQAPKELADRTEWLKQQIELQQCDSIADLRNIEPTENTQTIFIKGYYTGTTVGGGYFIADFTDNSTADNGGTVIVTAGGKRWKRIYTEITPFEFGAVGDGVIDDTAVFERLEQVIQGQPVNLLGALFKTSKNIVGNRYFNGEIKLSGEEGCRSQQLQHSLGGLYVRNSGTSSTLFNIKPEQSDNLTYYLQGLYQDFKTGELWTLQADSGVDGQGRLASLVKYAVGYGLELEPLFHTRPSAHIGHQCFGIQYEENVRYFWSTVGTTKGRERAKYVVRFTVNENTSEIENERFFKIGDDAENGDGNRCLTITPNGEFLIVTTSENRQGDVFHTVKVFRISDLIQVAEEQLASPMWTFPIYRIENKWIQSITSDGEYVYVLQGRNSLARNTVQVFTIDGSHVLTDTQCFIGIEQAKSIGAKGGTTFYEPETLAIMQSGAELILTYGITVGQEQGQNYKKSLICTPTAHKPTIHRTRDGMPAAIFASKYDIGIPLGDKLTIVETDARGECIPIAVLGLGSLELVNNGDKGQSQLRVKNTQRNGMLQVSNSGNLGVFDLTNSKWLLYSGVDGIAKLGMETPANANGSEVASAGWVKGLIKSGQRTNGWVKLPDGLIFQWGRYSASNGSTFNYPIAFNEPPFIVQCTDRNNDGTQVHTITTRNETATTFEIISGGAIGAFTMWAVGK